MDDASIINVGSQSAVSYSLILVSKSELIFKNYDIRSIKRYFKISNVAMIDVDDSDANGQ